MRGEREGTGRRRRRRKRRNRKTQRKKQLSSRTLLLLRQPFLSSTVGSPSASLYIRVSRSRLFQDLGGPCADETGKEVNGCSHFFREREVAANSSEQLARRRRSNCNSKLFFSLALVLARVLSRPLSRSKLARIFQKNACLARRKRHATARGALSRFAFFQSDIDGSWLGNVHSTLLSLPSLSLFLLHSTPTFSPSPLSAGHEPRTRHLSHPAALSPAARAFCRRRSRRPAPGRGRPRRHSVRGQLEAERQAQRHDDRAAASREAQAGADRRGGCRGVQWRGGGGEVREISKEKEILKEREEEKKN